MAIQKKIDRLSKILSTALQKPLPGASAQFKLSPPFRDQIPPGKDKKDAAVLILIYPRNDELFTVFIKRNNYNGPHSGQISFPGGKFDETDASLGHTAIRETNEEIGTKLGYNDLMGNLSSLYIPISKFDVSPFVATIDYEPEFHPDLHEVKYIIEIPLNILLHENKIQTMEILVQNTKIKVPCFKFNNTQIWGATAMMLNEFIELLKDGGY